MKKVIAFANQKGGVGKTTSAIAFAAGLAKKQNRILLVDADDSNPSATKFLGYKPDQLQATLTDLMLFTLLGRDVQEERKKAILHHEEGFDILPADNKLAGVTSWMSSQDDSKKQVRLRELLSQLKEHYDYIILDAAPALNIMSVNILSAADEIIITTQPQGASESGIGELLQTIANVKENVNENLIVRGLLITMVDKRTNYNKSKIKQMTDFYTDIGMRTFDTYIPRTVKAEEYTDSGKSILAYDSESTAAIAYKQFLEEYLEEK